MPSAERSSTSLEEVLEVEENCMARLADSFEASARRWELIVYPSLIAFILLAAYGFWLIYNLTHDIADVAKSVREMTASVTEDLGEISGKMTHIAAATSYMAPMSRDMRTMTRNVSDMAVNTNHMQYTMWQLNRNVSAPFNAFDNMMPFGSSRPYGRQSSKIAPPIYPRAPVMYYQPQVVTPDVNGQNQADVPVQTQTSAPKKSATGHGKPANLKI
jgi:hypothetical protein